MGMLTKIDLTLRRMIYSIFWFFYSPLNMTRLVSQLQNRVNREIRFSSDGQGLIAPDRFEILVNPVIYRDKRNEINAIQSKLEYDLWHYIENQGYLIRNSSINVSVFSMSRVRKNGIEIRRWTSGRFR